jgi:hypothetical protein
MSSKPPRKFIQALSYHDLHAGDGLGILLSERCRRLGAEKCWSMVCSSCVSIVGGQIKIGVDVGFICGNIGRAACGDIAFSDVRGFGTSTIFTTSKGALSSIEVKSSIISNKEKVSKELYLTSDVASTLNGEAKASDKQALVSKLHAAIEAQQVLHPPLQDVQFLLL